MPIYEYQCRACGHQLEAIQKVSDAPLKQCPKCHKKQLKKLISKTAFQLKGTGWYETDFSGKKKESKPECPPEKCAKTPECPKEKKKQ